MCCTLWVSNRPCFLYLQQTPFAIHHRCAHTHTFLLLFNRSFKIAWMQPQEHSGLLTFTWLSAILLSDILLTGHIALSLSLSLSLCACVCVYVCVHISVCACSVCDACVCICMCVCVCVCVCVCDREREKQRQRLYTKLKYYQYSKQFKGHPHLQKQLVKQVTSF